MADGDLFSYAVVGFFVGLFMFYKGIRAFRKKRLLENMPTSKIRSIAMGLVEIFGKVEPQLVNGLLKGPLSKKDCVYYRYKVEEYRSSGKSGHWVTINKGEKGVPFFVRDETGVVLVDPKGANVDIHHDIHFTTGFRKNVPHSIISFLENSGIRYNPKGIFRRRLRFYEYRLTPGDKCYVIGEAGDNPFLEDATGKKNVDDIMIRKPTNGIKYYISDKSEKDILENLQRNMFYLVFGPLLSVGSLIVIFLYMGINI